MWEYRYKFCGLPTGVSILPRFAAMVCSTITGTAKFVLPDFFTTSIAKGTKVISATSFVISIDVKKQSIIKTKETALKFLVRSKRAFANEENTQKITEYLKENSRGYTTFAGQGSRGSMNMIFIVLPRRDVVSVTKQIRKLCSNNVFVVVDDVNKYVGGFGMIKYCKL